VLGFLARRELPAQAPRPQLELSGPRLESALARLAAGCEPHGGLERYVEALKLKSALFREALDQNPASLEAGTFKQLCAFMSTVRRRVGPWLEEPCFDQVRGALVDLLAARSDTATTDARVTAFCASFTEPAGQRWVRDLAAEVLHNVDPERFPLMMRWVWDAGTNTGVLREIWHAPDVDHVRIGVPDGYDSFVVLREELSQYLAGQGFFRDVSWYVDLLCAQVYAGYISEQGGSYLRTDFAAEEDPVQHTRRLLGLDGVQAGSGRSRLKTIDGTAFVLVDGVGPTAGD
jgi:hypothetical protein